MIYFDTSYLVRLYVQDKGFEAVRRLCADTKLACCSHGRLEVFSALHRRLREGLLSRPQFESLFDQFEEDSRQGYFTWLPLTETMMAALVRHYKSAPESSFLRAFDAIHLACAAENGFAEIHSNDRHLLAAAHLFGLKGCNVIPD